MAPVAPVPNAPGWLVARPIAHRGLHDRTRGIVENSAFAAKAAVSHDYAVECDVQASADGQAMVFHDFTLDRMTGETGPLAARTAQDLRTIEYADTVDRIVTLAELLTTIDGRVPLVVEVKSAFDGDHRLADRVADTLASYAGPAAIKSFDPGVVAHLRARVSPLEPPRPLGLVAMASYEHPEWAMVPAPIRRAWEAFAHWDETRPDFLSFHVGDLPHAVPHLLRRVAGLPVMAWTVRQPAEREVAGRWADQMVFEGFVP